MPITEQIWPGVQYPPGSRRAQGTRLHLMQTIRLALDGRDLVTLMHTCAEYSGSAKRDPIIGSADAIKRRSALTD
jgi:hypothetical protein